jgi:hypothetical protein
MNKLWTLLHHVAAVALSVAAANVEAPALNILRLERLGDGFKDAFRLRGRHRLSAERASAAGDHPQLERHSAPGNDVRPACLLARRDERIGVLVGGAYVMTATAFELLSGAGDVERGASSSMTLRSRLFRSKRGQTGVLD